MKIDTYLTEEIKQSALTDEFKAVMRSLAVGSGGLRNAVTFLVRNVLFSYHYDKSIDSYVQKENLHENQTQCLDLLNRTILLLNADKVKKYDKKMAEWNSLDGEQKANKPEPKLNLFLPYEKTITKNTYYQCLNDVLLENSIKLKESESEFKDYTVLPSYVTQAVLQKTAENFRLHFKALSKYSINPEAFKGKPQMPGFFPKGSTCGFELDVSRFSQSGKLMTMKSAYRLYSNSNKTEFLNSEILDKYNALDVKTMLGVEKFKTIRIVPSKNNSGLKVEVVKVINIDIDESSFLGQVIAKYPSFYEKKLKHQNDVLREMARLQPSIKAMGLDMGMNNVVTMAFTNGDKSLVVTGKQFLKDMAKLDLLLDKRKSTLTSAKIKELQDKKEQGTKLEHKEIIELNAFTKTIYADAQYSMLLARKNNITEDFLHKLSKAIVEMAMEKGIELMVVGKNHHWKTESNMGSKNNRTFHNLPHAKLIELIRYKAMLQGIALLEQEESYTSKANFVNDDVMPIYQESKSNKQLFSGKRNKNWYEYNINNTKKKLHADVNGALNILRKALVWFKNTKNICLALKHKLHDLKLFGKKKFWDYTIQKFRVEVGKTLAIA